MDENGTSGAETVIVTVGNAWQLEPKGPFRTDARLLITGVRQQPDSSVQH